MLNGTLSLFLLPVRLRHSSFSVKACGGTTYIVCGSKVTILMPDQKRARMEHGDSNEVGVLHERAST